MFPQLAKLLGLSQPLDDNPGAGGGGQATPASPAAPVAPAAPVQTNLDTPAAPAAPATPATPAPDDKGKQPAWNYPPTGDASLDFALGRIGALGIGPNSVEMVEAKRGNFELLRVKLNELGEKSADAIVGIGQRVYEADKAGSAANQAEVSKAVTEVAGSAEEWNTVFSWAKQNAEPEEKALFNSLLQTPLGARVAATYLMGAYAQATGANTVDLEPRNPANQNSSSVPAGNSNEPLSAAGFAREVEKLVRVVGDANYQNTPQYRALVARRQATPR